MGIFDRLGQVLRSYLNIDEETSGSRNQYNSYNDPDVDAAFEELNEFLKKDKTSSEEKKSDNRGTSTQAKPKPAIPEELRPDFAELEVSFGASAEECKDAYKRLLKIHHPDKHANHEGNFKKATNKTARLNAAYERIARWRVSG